MSDESSQESWGYGEGYAAGKDKVHFEIRNLDWQTHDPIGGRCGCEPCQTVRAVLAEYHTQIPPVFTLDLNDDTTTWLSGVEMLLDKLPVDDHQSFLDSLRELWERSYEPC